MQLEMNSCAAIYLNKIMCTPATNTPTRLVLVCLICSPVGRLVCVFIQMAGTHTSALLDNPLHKSCSALIYMAACCCCWLLLQSLLVCRPTAARRSSIPHTSWTFVESTFFRANFARTHISHARA
jgi:hypothetical protein